MGAEVQWMEAGTPLMKRIRVTLGGEVVAEVDADRELILGRGEGVDIRIQDGEISSRHLRIRPEGGGVVVTDLGSTNGSMLDDNTALVADQDLELERGHKLMVGPAMIEVVESASAAGEADGYFEADKTVAVGGAGMQAALNNVARFKAAAPRLVIGADHDRRTVPISEMETVIGRDRETCQIEIPHASVSAKHASLVFDGTFQLKDHGSSNGTFVDGNRISGATAIQPETALRIGTVDCLFVCNQPESDDAAQLAESLANHAAKMSKVTQAQAAQVLDEHRKTGRLLGELFVEKGMLSPQDWADLWRQRDVIATLGSGSSAAGGSNKMLYVVLLALVIAVIGFLVTR
jgi:pSer/pThr/pTyr-binding forkhead associated (FHA) protein